MFGVFAYHFLGIDAQPLCDAPGSLFLRTGAEMRDDGRGPKVPLWCPLGPAPNMKLRANSLGLLAHHVQAFQVPIPANPEHTPESIPTPSSRTTSWNCFLEYSDADLDGFVAPEWRKAFERIASRPMR